MLLVLAAGLLAGWVALGLYLAERPQRGDPAEDERQWGRW